MRENYNTVIPPTLLVCLPPPKRAVNGIAQYSHKAETGKTRPAHLQSKTHHQTQGVLGRLEKIQTKFGFVSKYDCREDWRARCLAAGRISEPVTLDIMSCSDSLKTTDEELKMSQDVS